MGEQGKIRTLDTKAKRDYAYHHANKPINVDLSTSTTMDIIKVAFSNQDIDGLVISDYGKTMYEDDLEHVCARIYYKGPYSKDQHVTLYYKIFDAEGNLKRGYASPQGFTGKQDVVIKSGTRYVDIHGLDNGSATSYKERNYDVGFWLNGTMIHKATFCVEQQRIPHDENNSAAFLKALLTYPMGDRYFSVFDAPPQTIKEDLSKKHNVDDRSDYNIYYYWIWAHSSPDIPYMKYHGMPFDYFYYREEKGQANAQSYSFGYAWKLKQDEDYFAIIHKIGNDFRLMDANADIKYDGGNETYLKARCEVKIGGKCYTLEVKKYADYEFSIKYYCCPIKIGI